jgi:ribonucleotide monophosphatase NagD (HAD superfamily)
VLSELGRPDPATVLVVGDRPSTDGLFAVTLGSPFALVRTGVTGPGDSIDLPVAIDAPDLAAVVDALDRVESADR